MTAPPRPSCVGFPNPREVSLLKLRILLGRCQPQVAINCALRRICPMPHQEISSHTEDSSLPTGGSMLHHSRHHRFPRRRLHLPLSSYERLT